MKTVSISGSPRASVGKKDARDLRRQGMVPCVLYGGTEQLYFSVHENNLTKLVYTPDVFVVKLDIGGKQADAIMKEIQVHRVNEKLSHIDFLEILPGKDVVVDIPVKIQGTAIGVKEGGRLILKHRTLKMKGLVEKMPDAITLNIEALKIGDSIKVSDVKVAGVVLLDGSNNTVVGVRVTRNVVEETPVALATQGAAPAAGAAAPAAGAAASAAGAPAAAGAKKPDAAAAKKPEGKK